MLYFLIPILISQFPLSSLFSVDEYEEEQIDNVRHEPEPSQATLVGNELGVRRHPIRVSRARKPSNQQVVPTEEREESTNIAEPEPPIPPVASIPSQGKRKRGQKAQIPTDNTPYRNTRSMSDTVKRLTATSLANPRPAKRGRKKKPVEATQDEEPTVEEPQGLPAPVPETITTDEADVEQLLMSEPNVEGPHTPSEDAKDHSKRRRLFRVSSSEEEEEAEEEDHQTSSSRSPLEISLSTPRSPLKVQLSSTPRSPLEVQLSSTPRLQAQSLDSEVERVEETLREQSLDTDDEQIDRELSRPRTVSGYDDVDPMELLKEFNDSTASDLPAASPSPATSSNQWLSLLAGDEQDAGSDPWRESSVESFPKQGTRASAIKKQVEEKRKMEEYVPPPTSRAARYARRQRK